MLCALVLLLVLPVLLVSCREDTPVTPAGGGVQLHLGMSTGDTYRFDRWLMDQYVYVVPNSKMAERWAVVQTGVAAFAESTVTVIDDSLGNGTSATLYLLVAPTGELYEYGFLDRVVRQMGIGKAPLHWDLLAPSELLTGQSWMVGVADSASQDTVYGSFTSVPEYFSLQLNGVPSVIPAYRIDLTGQRVQYSFWITDAPTCITAFQEQSNSFGPGFEAFLTWASVRAQLPP